ESAAERLLGGELSPGQPEPQERTDDASSTPELPAGRIGYLWHRMLGVLSAHARLAVRLGMACRSFRISDDDRRALRDTWSVLALGGAQPKCQPEPDLVHRM